MDNRNTDIKAGYFLQKALEKSENSLKRTEASHDSFAERYKTALINSNSRAKSQNSNRDFGNGGTVSGLNLRQCVRSGNEHSVCIRSSHKMDGVLQPLHETDGQKLNGPNCNESKTDSTKFCVCVNCGSFSRDHNSCDRCEKLLPANSKTYLKDKKNCGDNIVTSTDSSKFYKKKIQDKVYQNILPFSRKRVNTEPACVTLSSDEEEHNSLDVTRSPEIKSSVIRYPQVNKDLSGKRRLMAESPIKPPTTTVSLKCRSIRIGSFRFVPDLPVIISDNEILIHASLVSKCNISIQLQLKEIVELRYYTGNDMPVFFLDITPACASEIRTKLNMQDEASDIYINPDGSNEQQKRITILPDKVLDDQKGPLLTMFRKFKEEIKVTDISHAEANKILVLSTPHSNCSIRNVIARTDERNSSEVQFTTFKKMMTYPPPPQTGGITINPEDFKCLDEGEFLNDVIIDFYLKYLVQHKLSETDRQRTHIFSSFFWRRLTQRAGQRTSTSEEAKLSLAEQRHNRVKTWTRHVDIFKKDFIIIPINENSHWFLAVICFCTLDEPQPLTKTYQTNSSLTDHDAEYPHQADNVAVEEEREWLNSPEEESTIEENSSANTTFITGIQDDEDVSNVSAANTNGENLNSPIVQPCILIFDSLLGRNHGRIVSTLREYLRVEWKAKNDNIRTFDKERVKGSVPKVPQQANFSDCGIYLLQYVESFFQDPIKDFTIPINSLKNWFTIDKVGKKRDDIKQLILQLQLEQEGSSGS